MAWDTEKAYGNQLNLKISIKASIFTTRKTGLEFINGQMARSIKVILKKTCKMVKEFLSQRKGKLNSVSGRMEKQ